MVVTDKLMLSYIGMKMKRKMLDIREVIHMKERLTWEQIQDTYPDQWVGLTEVEYEPDNHASIKSAVVRYTDKPKGELTRMMLNGEIISRYTTPDRVFQIGMVGVQ